jgi:DNA-binding NarL/FixJ family response regulator
MVVSMHDEQLYAERALHAGARGYMMKDEAGAKLLEAIDRVLAGSVYVSSAMSKRIIDVFSGARPHHTDTTIAALTDREFEVFELLGQGLTTQEIGVQLRLSPKTVESHRLHIREKLKVKTGPELIKQAVRWSGAQGLL